MLLEIMLSNEIDNVLRPICPACNLPMEVNRVAMVHRMKPGGSFQAICLDCAHTVIKAAIRQMELENAIEVAFKL